MHTNLCVIYICHNLYCYGKRHILKSCLKLSIDFLSHLFLDPRLKVADPCSPQVLSRETLHDTTNLTARHREYKRNRRCWVLDESSACWYDSMRDEIYTNASFPIGVLIRTDQICFHTDAYLAISGQGINPPSKHSSN